jgi:hypothetical protein
MLTSHPALLPTRPALAAAMAGDKSKKQLLV